MNTDDARESMVATQLASRDITDPRVLAAMAAVPRHLFVPETFRDEAYEDSPIPIGCGQTISQPYVVAWMTQKLDVAPGAKVLEIGTGCGYQTAVLAALGADVYSLEIVPELAARAKERLAMLGYPAGLKPRPTDNPDGAVHLRTGSGYEGWPEAAPFDRIIVTAAPPEIPPRLLDQLADGGRLVAPVGRDDQVIVIVERAGNEFRKRATMPVRFVPMVDLGL